MKSWFVLLVYSIKYLVFILTEKPKQMFNFKMKSRFVSFPAQQLTLQTGRRQIGPQLEPGKDDVQRQPTECEQRHNGHQHFEHLHLALLHNPFIPLVHRVRARLALARCMELGHPSSPYLREEQYIEQQDHGQRNQVLEAEVDHQEVDVGQPFTRPYFLAQLEWENAEKEVEFVQKTLIFPLTKME